MIHIKRMTPQSWRQLKQIKADYNKDVIVSLKNGRELPLPNSTSVAELSQLLKIQPRQIEAVTLAVYINTGLFATTVTAYEK
jgi:hypothetical protein